MADITEVTRRAADPAVRSAVRAIMAAHSPLSKPLSAKAINRMLPEHWRRSDGDIRHHMRTIWAASIDVASIPVIARASHHDR